MNNNLSVNERYREILFDILRQMTNGVNLPIGIQVPDNLIQSVLSYLDLNKIRYRLVSIENSDSVVFIAEEENKSKLEDFRFSYYRKEIENFNKDFVRRMTEFRLAIHPLDYKFNQNKLEDLVDSINMYSNFAEYIYLEFVSGNTSDCDYIELKLESKDKSIERVINRIDDYLKYVEDFDFKPLKFKFSRKNTYEELVKKIEEDKMKNYRKWFNFKFTSYINGDLIIVEKKY